MANRYKTSLQEGKLETVTTTIKCALKTIIRPEFEEKLIDKFTEMSFEATKICVLGSLLFLLLQKAYERRLRN